MECGQKPRLELLMQLDEPFEDEISVDEESAYVVTSPLGDEIALMKDIHRPTREMSLDLIQHLLAESTRKA